MKSDPKKQLINEEMQFLLQRDSSRFKRQLLARLLEEGCNLPMHLAKSLFYEYFTSTLIGILPAKQKEKLNQHISFDLTQMEHPHFYQAVLFFQSWLKQAEFQMIQASFQAIESIIKSDSELQLYLVNNITTGTDSQGEVTVRLEKGGRTVNGQGADTDIVIASAKSYINALNKIMESGEKQHPQV